MHTYLFQPKSHTEQFGNRSLATMHNPPLPISLADPYGERRRKVRMLILGEVVIVQPPYKVKHS